MSKTQTTEISSIHDFIGEVSIRVKYVTFSVDVEFYAPCRQGNQNLQEAVKYLNDGKKAQCKFLSIILAIVILTFYIILS